LTDSGSAAIHAHAFSRATTVDGPGEIWISLAATSWPHFTSFALAQPFSCSLTAALAAVPRIVEDFPELYQRCTTSLHRLAGAARFPALALADAPAANQHFPVSLVRFRAH